MKVYFIGAGPGDPDLITVKGKRLITEADVVIYAGSLINPLLLDNCKPGCELHDSAPLNLPEILALYKAAVQDGKTVVRLHSGEPSLYGAIKEQIDWLESQGIEYEVIPGVSSFSAAAAVLGVELTLPAVSQTVIITRMAGRTPVPAGQDIASLAVHDATMCIFLSVQMIYDLVKELKSGYSGDTPIAVVEHASLPDQRVVRGTLDTIAEKVSNAGIRKTAMIIVGGVLEFEYELSKLYDPSFDHGYRGAIE
ncbi:MAG TPA: precorrin-4 C(11)-methyltransferase [Candidatus Aquicultor sp.]|jgi:precorrin-4/cobalt-precorrin-4 C11-methyltransferase